MKADLNKIKAALQQLEQNPNNCRNLPAAASEQDSTADTKTSEATSKAANITTSAPIPPLQPNRKTPTLPTFNSLGTPPNLRSEENVGELPNLDLLLTMPPTPLKEEMQQVIQQIENLYNEGPIVDGWLESYPCEPTSSNDERTGKEAATSIEYVKAGSWEKDKVVFEAPRSCYRLNGVTQTGQPWSYPCPLEQLPSVSVAIARYEKLLQLIDRKRDLETRLK